MTRRHLTLFAITAAVALGQQPPAAPEKEAPQTTIRQSVDVVIAPTTVYDSHGRVVNGLRASDFNLYDNNKLQHITEDVGFLPLSVVVCIQANNETETILPQVKKIGPVLRDLLVGQDGEVAILSFDGREPQKLTDFTNDPDKIQLALDKLKPGSSASRLLDATLEAVHMLRYKKDRRKVIVLISETRDNSSGAKVREVAQDLQLWNIDVYTVNISTWVTKLTTKPGYPKPSPIPTTSATMVPGALVTPTTVAQNTGAPGYAMEMAPLFEEIFRGVKGMFINNPAEAFTKMTGGKEFSFVTAAQLQKDIASIGDELHSQYLLSYNPNDKLEGGYHSIKVEVLRPGLKVRTRPGYWMAAKPD
jgi:VWFA-related protein